MGQKKKIDPWDEPIRVLTEKNLSNTFFAKQLGTNVGNVHYALLMPDGETKNCGVRAVVMSDKDYVVLNHHEHAPKGCVQINHRMKKQQFAQAKVDYVSGGFLFTAEVKGRAPGKRVKQVEIKMRTLISLFGNDCVL